MSRRERKLRALALEWIRRMERSFEERSRPTLPCSRRKSGTIASNSPKASTKKRYMLGTRNSTSLSRTIRDWTPTKSVRLGQVGQVRTSAHKKAARTRGGRVVKRRHLKRRSAAIGAPRVNGPRVRRVVIAGELLEQALRTGYRQPMQILEGLPEGARFVSGGSLGGDRRLVLLFEHESFEPWYPAEQAAPEQPIVVGSVGGPLRIVPGDLIVIRYPHRLMPEHMSGIRSQLSQVLETHFGFKVRALVLDDGADLGSLLRISNN